METKYINYKYAADAANSDNSHTTEQDKKQNLLDYLLYKKAEAKFYSDTYSPIKVKYGMYKQANPTAAEQFGAAIGGVGQSLDSYYARLKQFFEQRGGVKNYFKGLGKQYIYDPIARGFKWVDNAGVQAAQFAKDTAAAASATRAAGPHAVTPPPPTPRRGWFGGFFGGGTPTPAPRPAAPAGTAAMANFGRRWGLPIAATAAASAAAYAYFANRKRRLANQSQMQYAMAPPLDRPDPDMYKMGMYLNYNRYPYMTKLGLYNPYMTKNAANIMQFMQWIRRMPGAAANSARNFKNLTRQGWNKGGFFGVSDEYINALKNRGTRGWNDFNAWWNKASGGNGFTGLMNNINANIANRGDRLANYMNNVGSNVYNYGNNLVHGTQPLYNRVVDAPSRGLQNMGTSLKDWWTKFVNQAKSGWNAGAAESAALYAPKMASYRVRKVAAFIKK